MLNIFAETSLCHCEEQVNLKAYCISAAASKDEIYTQRNHAGKTSVLQTVLLLLLFLA